MMIILPLASMALAGAATAAVCCSAAASAAAAAGAAAAGCSTLPLVLAAGGMGWEHGCSDQLGCPPTRRWARGAAQQNLAGARGQKCSNASSTLAAGAATALCPPPQCACGGASQGLAHGLWHVPGPVGACSGAPPNSRTPAGAGSVFLRPQNAA